MKLYHTTGKSFEKFSEEIIWPHNCPDCHPQSRLGFYFADSLKYVENLALDSPKRAGFIKTLSFEKLPNLFVLNSALRHDCWLIRLRCHYSSRQLVDIRQMLIDNGYAGIHFVKPMIDKYISDTPIDDDYANDQYCIWDVNWINAHLDN